MYRIAEQNLLSWHQEGTRKPLIIRGARQVGKSTLVRNFAKNTKLTLYEINLERYPKLENVFASFDIKLIIRELSAILKNEIILENSILFLDEIQITPSAIQALRYFYEELPSLAVIAAGSLLEFVLADHNFSMPVGRVEYLHLYPMSFEEFLLAKQENYLLGLIKNYSWQEDIAQGAHSQLFNFFREYLIVGGMPEAVKVFVESQNLEKVNKVHDSIIATYQDDFGKYAKNKDLLRLHNIFNYVPRAIGEKIKYVNISREDQAREMKFAIDLLSKARVITKSYHSDCSGIPLSVDINTNVYKLFFLDVGLANRICGLSWIDVIKLDELRLINEGAIAEQFIAQHLLLNRRSYEQPNLFYWLREQKSVNAEVDFVTNIGKEIVPIEVKSGKSGTLKSLMQFVYTKKAKYGVRFDLNLPSIQEINHLLKQEKEVVEVKYKLLSLPLYLVGQLQRLYMQANEDIKDKDSIEGFEAKNDKNKAEFYSFDEIIKG